jgi:hypothetical protein
MSKFLKKGRRILPPLKVGTTTLLSQHEKAEAIASNLKIVHMSVNNPSPEEISVAHSILTIDDTFLEPITSEELTKPIEIKKYLKALKTSKAPGVDKINNRLLKNLP